MKLLSNKAGGHPVAASACCLSCCNARNNHSLQPLQQAPLPRGHHFMRNKTDVNYPGSCTCHRTASQAGNCSSLSSLEHRAQQAGQAQATNQCILSSQEPANSACFSCHHAKTARKCKQLSITGNNLSSRSRTPTACANGVTGRLNGS